MRRGLAAARAGSDADFALYAYASTARLPHLLDAIEALTAERDALKGEVRTMMRRGSERMGLVCWYAAHRAKVEADHAAAVQAKRQAECRNCRDGFPAYGTWPDWHICPMCKRDCRPDAAKAAGIDMDLLAKLCREEPDADTKREVDEMMAGIEALDGGPSILCHPEWPTLMAEALAQVKAGD